MLSRAHNSRCSGEAVGVELQPEQKEPNSSSGMNAVKFRALLDAQYRLTEVARHIAPTRRRLNPLQLKRPKPIGRLQLFNVRKEVPGSSRALSKCESDRLMAILVKFANDRGGPRYERHRPHVVVAPKQWPLTSGGTVVRFVSRVCRMYFRGAQSLAAHRDNYINPEEGKGENLICHSAVLMRQILDGMRRYGSSGKRKAAR